MEQAKLHVKIAFSNDTSKKLIGTQWNKQSLVPNVPISKITKNSMFFPENHPKTPSIIKYEKHPLSLYLI